MDVAAQIGLPDPVAMGDRELPKLAPDVLLRPDDVLSHPKEIADYVAERLPGFVSVTVPVGKGLHVAYRQKAT